VFTRPLRLGVTLGAALALISTFALGGGSLRPPASAETVVARIVTLDGISTEIVATLGAAARLVGRDDSSYEPASVTRLPSVGYQFALNAEGVISLKPTLVIGREDAKPVAALDAIRAAGVPLLLVSADASLDGARKKIRAIAAAVDRRARGEELIAAIDRSASRVATMVAAHPPATRPRAAFIYSQGLQSTLVCGTGSNAVGMLELAGAVNAFPDIRGCKAATAEALVAARPDVIVMFTMGLKAIGASTACCTFPVSQRRPPDRHGGF
jgi:iron complex transport system substrate-binding protein